MKRYRPKKKPPKRLFLIILHVVFSVVIIYTLIDALNYYLYHQNAMTVSKDIREIQDVFVKTDDSKASMMRSASEIASSFNNHKRAEEMIAINNDLIINKQDPWGTEYVLINTSTDKGGRIVVISAGKDKKYNTSDDLRSTVNLTYGSKTSKIHIEDDYDLRSTNWYFISTFIIILSAIFIRNINKASEQPKGWKIGWNESKLQKFAEY